MDVERVLCLTATATPNVAEDICKSFFIDPKKGVFRTPVYRPKYDFLRGNSRSPNHSVKWLVWPYRFELQTL